MIGLGPDEIQIKRDKKKTTKPKQVPPPIPEQSRALLKTWLSGFKLELLRRQKKAVKKAPQAPVKAPIQYIVNVRFEMRLTSVRHLVQKL